MKRQNEKSVALCALCALVLGTAAVFAASGLVAAAVSGETAIDTVTEGIAVASSGIGLDTRTTSTGEAVIATRFAGTSGFVFVIK